MGQDFKKERKKQVEDTGRHHLSVLKGLNYRLLLTPWSFISLVNDNFFYFFTQLGHVNPPQRGDTII